MLTTNRLTKVQRRFRQTRKRWASRPVWDTASSGLDPDTSPMELEALDRHARACEMSKGFWFATTERLDTLADFAAARPIGTLIAVAALLWALTS